jgi:hypothetical protein
VNLEQVEPLDTETTEARVDVARTESPSSCVPQFTHQTPGREPIGAVPTPTGVISRSVEPKRRLSTLRCNAVTLVFMPIFRSEEEPRVRELLDALDDFGAETQRIVEGIAALSERVTFRVEEQPEGFERYPAVAVLPAGEDVGVRYYGLPWGYELASLLGGVLEAGRLDSALMPESLERLAALERDLVIDVFVTPT